MQIDIPEVLAEITAVFARYEAAILANDVDTLTELFHDDARTIRYGAAEILYGDSRPTSRPSPTAPIFPPSSSPM